MKILAIQASPNHDGLTARAAKAVLKGFKDDENDVELIHLNDLDLEHCIACNEGWGKCRTEGYCILEDGLQELREKIGEVDALVFSTPVYWHDLSESAKTFLDRLRRVETHNGFSGFRGKKAVGIAAAGGSGNGACRALYLLEDYIRRLGFEVFDLVTFTQASREHKLRMLQYAGERLKE
ncbi:MAG: flavodoxin family protein [Candidatus Bathyarchaeia archaeon]